MSGALYIHVPFCRAKCVYCDFYSVPLDTVLATRYVTALRKEIQSRISGRLDTIYIGGGTPSVLPGGSIRAIIDCIGEHAQISDGAEVTLEANPDSLRPETIEEAMESGVNRMSVGVQTFDDDMLRLLQRPHTATEAIDAIEALHARHLDFSIDLMYSIPGQTPGDWENTLETAINLGPSHISAYELAVEPETQLDLLVGEGKLRMAGEDRALEMYSMCKNAMEGAGYEHYEVSNYALAGKRSRHNMNYWRRGEYTGLGPGAVTYRKGIRTRNLPEVTGYCSAMENGDIPPHEDEFLTPEDASREFLMLGLRTSDGVGLEEAVSVYGIESLFEASSPLLDKGMMAVENRRLFLTKKGMPLMNTILVELFESLGL